MDIQRFEIDGITAIDNEIYKGGPHVTVSFANGYQASIIKHPGSYGVELAVVHGGRIVYDTPVTDDVLGWLDEGELRDALVAISHLPVRKGI